MRRLNSSRFWLSKLSTTGNTKAIMEESAEIIVQMISEEIKMLKNTSNSCRLSEEELWQLSCLDSGSEYEEVDDIWSRLDLLLYAWISVQKYFLRAVDDAVVQLLRCCLSACHSSVRLEAFQYLVKLLHRQLVNFYRNIPCRF